MIFKVSATKGILLLLWSVLVVSMVDNFLRPILISGMAKLPILLLFLGILGGLQTYGFIGILLGPLMIATAMTFVKIYRSQYNRNAPDAAKSSAP
jgi:predicted PurR-regulated permease PerM